MDTYLWCSALSANLVATLASQSLSALFRQQFAIRSITFTALTALTAHLSKSTEDYLPHASCYRGPAMQPYHLAVAGMVMTDKLSNKHKLPSLPAPLPSQ